MTSFLARGLNMGKGLSERECGLGQRAAVVGIC